MRILKANCTDLKMVKAWLDEEYKKNGEGLFDNFEVVENNIKQNQLFVAKNEFDFPVGFITGPLYEPSILSVKENFRI